MAIYSGYDTYSSYSFCVSCNGMIMYGCVMCNNCQRRISEITASVNIDKQIELSERRVAELLAKKEAMEQFGSDEDYGMDDAILFKRQFKKAGPAYTYVAVKTPVGWYITGTNASAAMTFEQMVEKYLLPANEVWVCAEWRQMR